MIEKVMLADSGIQISRVGLGTVKFGRNQGVHYPASFDLPDDKTCLNLLSIAKNSGINLLDTAPAYGVSEERLGKFLQGQRSEWILSTKVGEEFVDGKSFFDFSKTAVEKSIERSLQRLKTDYLDILLVHSNGQDKKIILEDEIFTTLAALKKSGKIRAFGISSKTVEGGLLALNFCDAVMVTFNLSAQEDRCVIQEAHKKNKAIFIKKALASGHLNQFSADDALKFVLSEPGVSSVILGTINSEHLQRNLSCAGA